MTISRRTSIRKNATEIKQEESVLAKKSTEASSHLNKRIKKLPSIASNQKLIIESVLDRLDGKSIILTGVERTKS